MQRFGSALNLNLHFHVVHLDGLFDRGADDALRFFQHTPTTEDIESLVVEIGLSCERWRARRGVAGDDEDRVEDEDDAQGVLQLASLSGTVALGDRAGKRVRRVVVLGGQEFALGIMSTRTWPSPPRIVRAWSGWRTTAIELSPVVPPLLGRTPGALRGDPRRERGVALRSGAEGAEFERGGARGPCVAATGEARGRPVAVTRWQATPRRGGRSF